MCTESTLIGHMIQKCQEYIDVISATFVPANICVADCQCVLCTTGILYSIPVLGQFTVML